MSKDMTIIVLGLWITILPYLGIPNSWRTLLFVLSGLAIAMLGLFMRSESLRRGSRRAAHHPFVENSAPADSNIDSTYERKEGISSLN
ncbi:hypothetical protein H7X87_01870 [Acetobacteraceae bacterium]|nr:hypothetical protein [Candidatus Parcubacteria bacterium]